MRFKLEFGVAYAQLVPFLVSATKYLMKASWGRRIYYVGSQFERIQSTMMESGMSKLGT